MLLFTNSTVAAPKRGSGTPTCPDWDEEMTNEVPTGNSPAPLPFFSRGTASIRLQRCHFHRCNLSRATPCSIHAALCQPGEERYTRAEKLSEGEESSNR